VVSVACLFDIFTVRDIYDSEHVNRTVILSQYSLCTKLTLQVFSLSVKAIAKQTLIFMKKRKHCELKMFGNLKLLADVSVMCNIF